MAAGRASPEPQKSVSTPSSLKTGRGDNFPIQQGQLQRWTKGRWVPFGGLWVSKRN